MNNAQPNDKTSVLYVIDGTEFGGGERGFLQLAVGLKDRFRIAVATSQDGEFAQQCHDHDITVYPFDSRHCISLRPVAHIVDAARQHGSHIVHSQGSRADFYSRLAAGRLPHTKQVCIVQMPVEGYDVGPLRRMLYTIMDRALEFRVHRFIVVSKTLQTFLNEKHHVDMERISLIYNGIEVDRFSPAPSTPQLRAELGIPQGGPLILCVGRMVWQKGFDVLIAAAPDVLASYPHVHFVLVGDGPLKSELETAASESKIANNIHFVGFQRDPKPWLQAADLWLWNKSFFFLRFFQF